jgi:hypothetical protein
VFVKLAPFHILAQPLQTPVVSGEATVAFDVVAIAEPSAARSVLVNDAKSASVLKQYACVGVTIAQSLAPCQFPGLSAKVFPW